MQNLKQYIQHVLDEETTVLSFQQITKELFKLGAKHIAVTCDAVIFELDGRRFSFPITDSREMRSDIFYTLLSQLLRD